jgi:hypothetical protein
MPPDLNPNPRLLALIGASIVGLITVGLMADRCESKRRRSDLHAMLCSRDLSPLLPPGYDFVSEFGNDRDLQAFSSKVSALFPGADDATVFFSRRGSVWNVSRRQQPSRDSWNRIPAPWHNVHDVTAPRACEVIRDGERYFVGVPINYNAVPLFLVVQFGPDETWD